MLKSRLDLILKELKLSGRAFERECGLTNGSYSSLGNGVGADKLKKILFRFPRISADWLITGRGEMMRGETPEKEVAPEDIQKDYSAQGDAGQTGLDALTCADVMVILGRMTDIISRQQSENARLIGIVERAHSGKADSRTEGRTAGPPDNRVRRRPERKS